MMARTVYTIHDYVPGVDVPTQDASIAEYWSGKERDVAAVTTA